MSTEEHSRVAAEKLPSSSLPHIEGYEAAAYYRPAMAEAEIGGDFYDVFSTAAGHIIMVIGDVSGKGLNAAIPTAMGKYMIRAYAAENLPPGEVVSRFNRALCENVPEGVHDSILLQSGSAIAHPNLCERRP